MRSPSTPETSYAVSTVYQGALYGMDLDLSAGSPAPLAIAVYDSVTSDEVVTATVTSVLFSQVDRASQTVWALEIVRLVNDSDRTYVPGPDPMQLLRFGLAEGAHDLDVETDLLGADVFQVDRGFGLVAGVPPGEHEVMYAYRFPYSDSVHAYLKTLRYGASLFRVLALEEVVEFSSDSLGPPETVTIGGRAYRMLEANDLPRGASVSVDLTGLPMASLGEQVGRGIGAVRWELAAPIGLGAFMVVLLTVVLWRRAMSRDGSTHVLGDHPAPLDERQAVVQMIAELDRRFSESAITEAQHRRRRAALTARLASLPRQAESRLG